MSFQMIRYVVETSTVKNYLYRRPLLEINENGEVVSRYRKNDKGVVIREIALLNIVGYKDNGKLVSFEPMDYANEFLLAHHIDNEKLSSNLLSRALVHYFSFVIQHQEAWDEDYDEDTFDELYDNPRPEWNNFPKRKSDKLTYLYSAALKDLVLNQENPEDAMARTTAKAYINAVVGFYKHHLIIGYQFNNPPFEHEIVKINYQTSGTNMKAYMTKAIHTTDLRLSFPKPSRSSGSPIENFRRDLRPFTNTEWQLAQNIITKTKRVVRHGKNATQMASLPYEFSLHFMICRYAGLRREEAASLHLGQIIKPVKFVNESGKEVYKNEVLKFGVGAKYGSLTKTKESGNKNRETIMPARLMEELYDYTQSERYKKRLAKFKAYCKEQEEKGNTAIFSGDDAIDKNKEYLFITQTGMPMFTRLQDFTNRWVEVRNTVNHNLDIHRKMVGSLHNLRSTFAVDIFRRLLRKIDPDKALDIVSRLLGHEDYNTTQQYLKIAQELPSADEIYEDVLIYTGVLDGFSEQL
ncbi:integrase [Photobacterium phosphoreum]|uniref:site-specific integrase n=1 Tax=Photobacterium phosphoreum TaxID=659 RepID=UPI0007F97FED|nr:site-specific integrase [Photobacterium phosphoreum]OBU44482.1 integrase [Photobacterium phosphoreum]